MRTELPTIYKRREKMKTVKEQFESMLPMTINCGDKKKVRKFLKAMGCTWNSKDDLTSHLLSAKYLKVHEAKVVNLSGFSYSSYTKYKQIKALIKQYKAELKQPEFTYPMYFRSNTNNQLVKFTSLSEGTVVEKGNGVFSNEVGSSYNNYVPHTYGCWTQVPHDTDTGFYDKQLVLCTDKVSNKVHIRAWDNTNKCPFSYYGSRSPTTNGNCYPISDLNKAIKPYLASLEG